MSLCKHLSWWLVRCGGSGPAPSQSGAGDSKLTLQLQLNPTVVTILVFTFGAVERAPRSSFDTPYGALDASACGNCQQDRTYSLWSQGSASCIVRKYFQGNYREESSGLLPCDRMIYGSNATAPRNSMFHAHLTSFR
jgi:hypothetical protein